MCWRSRVRAQFNQFNYCPVLMCKLAIILICFPLNLHVCSSGHAPFIYCMCEGGGLLLLLFFFPFFSFLFLNAVDYLCALYLCAVFIHFEIFVLTHLRLHPCIVFLFFAFFCLFICNLFITIESLIFCPLRILN